VLLTGAQGFIGSWLAEGLLAEGAQVVTLLHEVDAGSRFNRDGIGERCIHVRADLSDYESLVGALREHEIRAVFHLAAKAVVSKANRSPIGTFETNIRGTWSLLEACRTVGDSIERIVVASSDKAYGRHAELAFSEDSPLEPVYPYDVSKAATDMLARSYAVTYGMPIAVSRLANVYGGGDFKPSRIVPATIFSLLDGKRPVIQSDGSPERDYLYVEDAVSAYLAIAQSLDDPQRWGRAWNAGNDHPVAVREVVARLIAVAGADLEPDIQGQPSRNGQVDRQFLDSSAIRGELGWQPQWDLERGLAATWRWYSEAGSRRR
jgi:CDP-glucose 4,6-dehydratase